MLLATLVIALAGGLWAATQVYLDLWVRGGIERAQLDLAQAKRIPSLEFSFDCQNRGLGDGTHAAIVNVSVHNPGENPVVLNLGALEGVDPPEDEDFPELILHKLGDDIAPTGLHYLRLRTDGRTGHWRRVLVDSGSTTRIPFLFPEPQPGLYYVEFRAKMPPSTKRFLLEITDDTFDPDLPIWWTAARYIDFREDCGNYPMPSGMAE